MMVWTVAQARITEDGHTTFYQAVRGEAGCTAINVIIDDGEPMIEIRYARRSLTLPMSCVMTLESGHVTHRGRDGEEE